MGDSQCFLVEWYQPDLVESAVDAAIDRLAGSAAALRATLLVALTSPSDETLFAVVLADSAEVVVMACRQAGWHIDRLTAGVRARISAAGDEPAGRATGTTQGKTLYRRAVPPA